MKLETFEDGLTHLKYLMQFPRYDNSYVVVDKTVVNYSYAGECNIDYCKENNIPLSYLQRLGSTFVLSKGDFVFLHCSKEDCFINKWEKYLREKLKEKNLDLVYNNNDFLIDGYKIMGSFGQKINKDYYIYVVCMNIKDSSEVIKNVCLKESTKEPRALEYYGISTKEIEKWYLDFIFYFIK